jgi:hypothetical protein
MTLTYVKHTPISLKDHPQFNEKWLQDQIKEDPSILGLGDLELKDVERMQPSSGRLDLLLKEPDTGKRYEVELMLGTLDANHIIRTLEYWDIERKRYPQYDHCAVIVAEDIASRFLNVIGLFNSAIPLIAIQLNALQVGDSILLNFTTVLNEIVRGEDDDDDDSTQTTDRSYWEEKGARETVELADECLAILREVNDKCDLKYNKFYIGIVEDGRPNNFVLFRPKKQFLRIEAKVSDSAEWQKRFEDKGFVVLEGTSAHRRFIFTATRKDLTQQRALVKELFTACYQQQAE